VSCASRRGSRVDRLQLSHVRAYFGLAYSSWTPMVELGFPQLTTRPFSAETDVLRNVVPYVHSTQTT
jgi:hypothetical protein